MSMGSGVSSLGALSLPVGGYLLTFYSLGETSVKIAGMLLLCGWLGLSLLSSLSLLPHHHEDSEPNILSSSVQSQLLESGWDVFILGL